MTDALGALLLLFTALWLASLWLRNASIVDMWWGPAFVVALMASLGGSWPITPRGWLVLGGVILWASRLAWHIGRRNIGHGEDARYRAWRDEHGDRWWWRSYFQVFLLQAAIAWMVSWPLHLAAQAAAHYPAWFDIAGALLVAAGLAVETLADAQLAAYKRIPGRPAVLSTGLWRYSRHPNYFGEAVVWWGFGLIGAAASGTWWALASPALMTWLLVRVSGVSLLERGLLARKPGYADYVANTSAFVPWRPRKM
jgi:steroid 5-alpha reductase family enzyme